jgi:hypothetical protein
MRRVVWIDDFGHVAFAHFSHVVFIKHHQTYPDPVNPFGIVGLGIAKNIRNRLGFSATGGGEHFQTMSGANNADGTIGIDNIESE